MAARLFRSRPRLSSSLLAAFLMIGCDANSGGPSVPSDSSATDAFAIAGDDKVAVDVLAAPKGKGKGVRQPKEIEAAKPY